MPYEKKELTAELLQAIGVSPSSADGIHKTPLGRSCVISTADRIALVPLPFDHSTYPDQQFIFFCLGHKLIVWENPESSNPDSRTNVEIFVDEATEHLEDQLLIEAAKSAFSALHSPARLPSSFQVRGRKPLPKPPRPPEQVIKGINKAAEFIPKLSEDLVAATLIPLYVKPIEVAALVAHGERTSWAGLTDEGLRILKLALEKFHKQEAGGVS